LIFLKNESHSINTAILPFAAPRHAYEAKARSSGVSGKLDGRAKKRQNFQNKCFIPQMPRISQERKTANKNFLAAKIGEYWPKIYLKIMQLNLFQK
jgi:hypothetical protein